MKTLLAGLAVVAAIWLSLRVWRWTDQRAERNVWDRLVAQQPSAPPVFDPARVAQLPEPAQRYFRFAIQPGTPLHTVAEIAMEGELSLGDATASKTMRMRANQILAAPHGFVWKLEAGSGMMRIAGSDGLDEQTSWTRFWLLGSFPVARAGVDSDHARSAFGRCVAEAAFWAPAALLPSDSVRWDAIDASTAQVTVTHQNLEQAVDLTVDAEGRLTQVSFQRWSDANPQKAYRWQPFGGTASDFQEFGGFRLPTRIEAGNHFGTEEYFPFFKVKVMRVAFP